MDDQGHGKQRGRALARIAFIVLLSGFSFALTASAIPQLWVPIEDLGYSFNGDVVDGIDPGSPAAKGGLRVGDRFDPRASIWERWQSAGYNGRPANGQAYTFRIVRNRTPHTLVVRAPKEFGFYMNAAETARFVLALLVFISFAVVGTLLVLIRPNPLTWLFYLFCIGAPVPRSLNVISILTNLPMPLGFVLNLMRCTLLMIAYIAFLDFALRFPNMHASGWRARIERTLPVLLLLVIAYNFIAWFSQYWFVPWPSEVDALILPALYFPCIIIAVVSLLGTYRKSSTEARHRLSWVVLGTLVSYTTMLGRDVISVFASGDVFDLFCTPFEILTALAPIGMAYGILRHRVIDVRFVVNRAVVYTSITSVLVALLASTYWLIGRILQQTQLAVVLQLFAAIAIGVSLQRSYKGMENLINRWFFKSTYDAQEHLSRVAATLRSAESAKALETALVAEPVTALSLTAGALFRRRADGPFERTVAVGWNEDDNTLFSVDDPLVLHLESKHSALSLRDTRFTDSYLRTKTACSDEAFPIFSNGDLTAILLYGSHLNGTNIDPLETSSIETLARAAEQAYDSLRIRRENVQRLSEMLERLDNVAYDELHFFLAEQVIASIPAAAHKALAACAAIPNATIQDVVFATGDAADAARLTDLTSTSALIRIRPDATCVVHPLIGHILLRDFSASRDILLVHCAQEWKARSRHGRAAALYSEAGLRNAAADELEKHYSGGDTASILRNDEYGSLCASLELHEVMHRPNVWFKRSLARIFKDDPRICAREGQLVYEGARDQLSIDQKGLIGSLIDWMRVLAGERVPARSASQMRDAVSPPVRAFQYIVEADSLGRRGKLADSQAALKAANDLFVPIDELAAMQSVIRAMSVERIYGRFDEERALLDHATALLDAVHSPLAPWAVAENAISAWLRGDESALHSRTADLQNRIERDGVAVLSHLAASLAGRLDKQKGSESAHYAAFAFLVQTCNATDVDAALACAERADAAAALSGEPFVAICTSLVRAALNFSHRFEHFARAVEWSERVDAPSLHAAVRKVVLGDEDELFGPLLARLRAAQAGSLHALHIRVSACTVSRGEEPLQLSERETALAIALARRPEPATPTELAELLWPDLEETAAQRAVQTYVHRLRQRFHDSEAIELTVHGYRYRSDTRVDLWEVEQLIRSLPNGITVDEFTRLVLATAERQLNSSRPGYTINWEWFAPLERRIEEVLHTAQLRLANASLRAGDLDEALLTARHILERDELDEGAWEVIIRCCIAAGDRASAAREFRHYRTLLKRELNEQPSSELSDLVGIERGGS